MGVRCLQSYVEKTCKNVCRHVNIEHMANSHRRNLRRHENPVIAVDGMGLIQKVYDGSLDWVYGGQWTEFVSLLQDFVNRFEEAGIDLVIFFDGPVCPEKRREWVSRRMKNAQEIEDLFLILKHDKQQPQNVFYAPTSIATIIRFALKYRCKVDARSTVEEADIEIAQYARNNRLVFAILAQDSDFIIFDTKPYLSFQHLNMNELTTIQYDRQRLASNLYLAIEQLPLFSCLLGNDFIPIEMVKPFHRRICQNNRCRGTRINDVAPLVSSMIRSNGWVGNFRNTRELRDICSLVFGTQRKFELLRDGIKFYFLMAQPIVTEGFEFANHRHISCENFPAVYGVLLRLELDSSEALEDCTDSSLPPVNLVFRPIRQRAYSLLLRGKRIHIKEWCTVPRVDLSSPELISSLPIRIRGRVPPLEYLWCDKSHDACNAKMECFFACLGGALKPDHIHSVKQKYVTFCCMINFLLAYGKDKRPLLAPWEVAAFIAQAVSPKKDDPRWLNSLQVKRVDSRAVQLGSLIMEGITTFGLLLGLCGNPFRLTDNMPWNFFNGKLFHVKYLRAKAGARVRELCEYKEDVIDEFHRLLFVITFGTSFAGHRRFR